MQNKRMRKRWVSKTVETDGTHHRVGAVMLGGLGACLFGPLGAIIMGAIGYAVGRNAIDGIADRNLPEGSADILGTACLMDGDKEVLVTLKKDGTDTLTPFGRAVFGDKVSKTITYELEDFEDSED